jgi:hypothetical protein
MMVAVSSCKQLLQKCATVVLWMNIGNMYCSTLLVLLTDLSSGPGLTLTMQVLTLTSVSADAADQGNHVQPVPHDRRIFFISLVTNLCSQQPKTDPASAHSGVLRSTACSKFVIVPGAVWFLNLVWSV